MKVLAYPTCLYGIFWRLNHFTSLFLYSSDLTHLLQLRAKEPLDVMVNIHGGGFFSGTGASYLWGPQYLLDKDIVLVTFNYRLGVLGQSTSLHALGFPSFPIKTLNSLLASFPKKGKEVYEITMLAKFHTLITSHIDIKDSLTS
jgi:hypothetical protein